MNSAHSILILSNIPILVSGAIAIILYGKLSKELRVFSWFLLLSNLIQIPSVILYLNWVNNMILLHIYTLFGGAVLILFYRELFKPYVSKALLSWLVGIYIVFCIINSLFWESVFTFNTNGLTIQAIVLSCLSISYFSAALLDFDEKPKHRRAVNWINSGIFIYFISNLLLYYFGEFLMNKMLKGSPFREIWMIHSMITLVAYSCYSIGLWKTTKHST